MMQHHPCAVPILKTITVVISPSVIFGEKWGCMLSAINQSERRSSSRKLGCWNMAPSRPFIWGSNLGGPRHLSRRNWEWWGLFPGFPWTFSTGETNNSKNRPTHLSGELKSLQQGRIKRTLMVSNQFKDEAQGEDERQHFHHCRHLQQPTPLHGARFFTLPTILTLGRVAAVPLLIITFHLDGWWATTATTCIFITATFTDWLDGYIARKMQLGTPFGAFLDPVADKLMVAATLVLLSTQPFEVAGCGQVPWLLTVPSIAIICREISMSAVREWAASQNTKILEAVAVNSLGKWKTATQMTALMILLAARDSSLAGYGVVVSGVVSLYISAGLALWSLSVYIKNIWHVLLK